jgi:hypothetical protein
MPHRYRLLALLSLPLLACRAPALPELGTVEGALGVDGEAPQRPALPTSGAAVHACGPSVPDNALQLGESGALAHAVVAVQGGALLTEPQRQPAPLLDQRQCRFEPAVLAARAGQPLAVLNSDPLVHTVRAGSPAAPSFSLAMPLQGARQERALPAAPGVVPLRCDIHPWMRAVVRTFDHGHFTTTDAGGRFRLQLPAGTHTLVLWHPLLPEVTERVEVRAGQTVRLAHRWPASALLPALPR